MENDRVRLVCVSFLLYDPHANYLGDGFQKSSAMLPSRWHGILSPSKNSATMSSSDSKDETKRNDDSEKKILDNKGCFWGGARPQPGHRQAPLFIIL